MRYAISVFLLVSLTALANISSAQLPIWSVEAGRYVGKLVTFDEYANKVSYNPNTKTCLIKLADPDVAKSPTVIVIIHNIGSTKRLKWLRDLEGYTITITGKLLSNNGQFEINGDDPHTKIEQEKEARTIDPMPVAPVDTSHKFLDTLHHQKK